jgi:ATP-binding cassette, subfamily C (CFTR/MRP), member 1
MFIYTLMTLLGVFVVIVAVLPWFAIAVPPIMYIYYQVQRYYRPVSRDLQRLESLSRSPIFAQFSETLTGVATLRAFNKQEQFMKQNATRIDASNRSYYHLQVYSHFTTLIISS